MDPNESKRSGPIPIAPAPTTQNGPSQSYNQRFLQSKMPNTCQTCAKRKVKCDKMGPTCSRCRKGGFQCIYQAPQSRSRYKKISDDVLERLAQYERILQQNGLLHPDILTPQKVSTVRSRGLSSVGLVEPEASKTERELTDQGRLRCIDSNMWRSLSDDDVQYNSDDDEVDKMTPADANIRRTTPDPLTGAFLGIQQNILHYHPSHADAMALWKIYTENVEPICKVLHVPSTGEMVQSISQHPESALKTNDCLLFAIYLTAVFSITEEKCMEILGKSRSMLLQQFQFAARQALVNASFLKTKSITVLQAFHLFLISTRSVYDPHTYWILTGISARIGQRIGLHQDGEKLGLPPFEVELRRRLFYQIFPHDCRVSQFAGIDLVSLPEAWDTKPPLNINDCQIWPGMTTKPTEQYGATDMLFCLSRIYVGKSIAHSGNPINSGAQWTFRDNQEADKYISGVESEVEGMFIRYCDIVSPLHLLTVGLARSGIMAMRLKIRLSKIKDQTATDEDRKCVFILAQNMLDTDAALHVNAIVSRFQWHIKPFFFLGRDLLSPEEVEIAWKSITQLYHHHDELFTCQQALYVALRRLSLEAWEACQPTSSALEPGFISTLRILRDEEKQIKDQRGKLLCPTPDAALPTCPSSTSDANKFFDASVQNGLYLDQGLDFDVDDWLFWDQLIKDQQEE
ncbi:hypothetical protein N7513_005746 [Penicillium frequentans]|nr:hypothetical protein N7513_005746 [Penicillium glabrum]